MCSFQFPLRTNLLSTYTDNNNMHALSTLSRIFPPLVPYFESRIFIHFEIWSPRLSSFHRTPPMHAFTRRRNDLGHNSPSFAYTVFTAMHVPNNDTSDLALDSFTPIAIMTLSSLHSGRPWGRFIIKE